MMQLKDLKRQLQLMQKREERLQDQLSVLGGMQGSGDESQGEEGSGVNG